jgi:hypothetical protein
MKKKILGFNAVKEESRARIQTENSAESSPTTGVGNSSLTHPVNPLSNTVLR